MTRVFTHPTLARRRFEEIVRRPEPELDLVEASLVVALEENPRLDIGHYLEEVGGWSEGVHARTRGSHDVVRLVEAINDVLFEQEGFHGDEASDYYDPRSALLNEALDRHAGLPITLSILYIELSRRAGLPATGVSMPGRFLVKFSGDFGEIIVDPFDGGRVLSPIELQSILDHFYGGAIRLREEHLRSFTRREVLARELAQLKAAYLAQHEIVRAAATIDRLLILDERDADEMRERAALAMQLHAYETAIDLFERYLKLRPFADDRMRVLQEIAYLRAWMEQN